MFRIVRALRSDCGESHKENASRATDSLPALPDKLAGAGVGFFDYG